MSGTTGFLYHRDFMLYQFGPTHPFQPVRYKQTLDTLNALDVLDGEHARMVEPSPVEMRDLNRVHPPEFVTAVERTCQQNGLLDQGDTPGSPELFSGALMAVGGSVRGVQGIMEGEFEHAFNPAGGLHHARSDRSTGFCVFNDLAVAVRYLQEHYKLRRIAVVDIDGHHGDGTQNIFYREEVLTISLHRYGPGFYPGSGSVQERGEGRGKGLTINMPLPLGTDDSLYLDAYRAVVVPALRAYEPQFIIHQFGTDGHHLDPLVGLGLTTRGYAKISAITHSLAHELCNGRYLVTGGGGYDIDATRRAWTIMFVGLTGTFPDEDRRIIGLHDRSSPVSEEAVAATVENVIEGQTATSLPLLDRAIRSKKI